jgi:hypothetical protein
MTSQVAWNKSSLMLKNVLQNTQTFQARVERLIGLIKRGGGV